MKPTVINNSNSENTNQEQHPTDGANSGRGRYPQYSVSVKDFFFIKIFVLGQ